MAARIQDGPFTPGQILPIDTVLVGSICGIHADLHERDAPEVPCVRFEVKGLLQPPDSAAQPEPAEGRRRTKYSVVMHPSASGSAGSSARAGPSSDLRQAKAALVDMMKHKKQVALRVGGVRVEEGPAGLVLKLRGLQGLGSDVKGSETGVKEVDVKTPARSREVMTAVVLEARRPKAPPAHSRVVATGILDAPPAKVRKLVPITTLNFSSSSSSNIRPNLSAKAAGSSSNSTSAIAIARPSRSAHIESRTTLGTKRPRSPSPIAAPRVSPPVKRLESSRPSRPFVVNNASTSAPQLKTPAPRTPASYKPTPDNSHGNESIHNSSFGTNHSSAPKQQSSNEEQDSGGSGLMKRSPVSHRADSDEETHDGASSQPGYGYVSKTRALDDPLHRDRQGAHGASDMEDNGDDHASDNESSGEQLRTKLEAKRKEMAQLAEEERELEERYAAKLRQSRALSSAAPSPRKAEIKREPTAQANSAARRDDDSVHPGPSHRIMSTLAPMRRDAIIRNDDTLTTSSPSPTKSERRATQTVFASKSTRDARRDSVRPAERIRSPVAPPVPQASVYQAGPSRATNHGSSEDIKESKWEKEAKELQRRRDAQEKRIAQKRLDAQALDDLRKGLSYGDGQGRSFEYTALKDLRVHRPANVIGVVVSMHPNKNGGAGRDSTANLVITDPSLYCRRNLAGIDAALAFTTADDDVPITIWRVDQTELPPQLPMGSIVLISDLQITTWKNKPKGQSPSRSAGALCWLSNSGAEVMYPLPSRTGAGHRIRVTATEEDRMRALAQWYESLGLGKPVPVGMATAVDVSAKASLLGDLRNGQFADITFKILHAAINGSFRGPWCQLYITDGTRSTAQQPWRNYHNVVRQSGGSAGGGYDTSLPLPSDAVYCLNLMEEVPREEQPMLEAGYVLTMRNVRCSEYQGQLELKWSELVTEEQRAEKWGRRGMKRVERDDPRVKVINQRIKALLNGDTADPADTGANRQRRPGDWKDALDQPPVAGPSRPAPINAGRESVPRAARVVTVAEVPESDRIMTTYTDPLRHIDNTVEEIMLNKEVPHRYNVVARVDRLLGADGHSLVVKVCKPCQRRFADDYCKSCNDTSLSRASYQYRICALLSPHHPPSSDFDSLAEPPEFPVLIADEEALAFLPPLPPLQPSTNPNDARAIDRQIQACTKEAFDLLMGNKMDGERVRPGIRWSLETYTAVKRRKGKGKSKGKGKEREVDKGSGSGSGSQEDEGTVVYRVFGMTRKR